MKPVYRSFRFWVMLAVSIIGALTTAGVIGCPAEGCSATMAVIVKLAGMLTTLASTLGWTVSKAYVQAATAAPKLPEAVELVRLLNLKPDPRGATIP